MKPYLKLLLIAGFWALTGCHSTASFNFGAYSEAERFYEKRQYEKAITKYQAYVRENPSGNMAVIAQYYMGKSYEGLGRPDQAREIYEQISQKHPQGIWADFARSRLKELPVQSTPRKVS